MKSSPDFINELAKVIAHIHNTKRAEEFLLGILTPSEREEVARRLQILKLLKQGHSQWEVAKKLGVGIATVSRGAKELKYGNSKFLNTL